MQLYFFLTNDGKQVGPVPGEELLSHGVSHLTLVWGQNMTGWAPAETVDELKPLFAKAKVEPQPNDETQAKTEPKDELEPKVEAIPIMAKTIETKTKLSKDVATDYEVVDEEVMTEDVSVSKGGKGWKYLSFGLMVAVVALAVLYFTKSSGKYTINNSNSDYIEQLEAENKALTEKIAVVQEENDTLNAANDYLINANRNLRQSQGGGEVVYETPAAVQQELEQLRARNRQLEAQMRRYQESLPD